MTASRAIHAIRKFCLDCQGGSSRSIAGCPDAQCALYSFRSGMPPSETDKKNEPVRAVRRQCLACADSRQGIRQCAEKNSCPLWSYRFGVLPSTFKRVAARRKKYRETLLLPGIDAQFLR